MLQRKDYVKNQTENFTYDNLDRLTSTQVVGQSAINMGFSSTGNITSKTDVGTYNYHQTKIYAVTSISNTNSVVPSFNQNISYTAYERPASIAENAYNLNYTYGADYERIKGIMTQNGSAVYTRYFLGDYEKTVSANGTSREIHYISSPAGLIAIVERVNSVDNYHYVYTDHLGSILTVANSSGNIEAEQSFDAWGRRRNPSTWVLLAPTAATGLPAWLYRGYTGHEHLDEFGIINMNARLYDPVLGRMISPDNFVNGAFASQAYNRYSYANNNPLKYIDPDGNNPIVAAILIAAALDIFSQVMTNEGFNNFSWSSLGVSVLMGAVSGGMSSAIGWVVEKTGAGLLAQSCLHGLSSSVQAMIFGNDPLAGFASGIVSSLTAGLIPKSFTNKIGLLGNYVLGGASSALTTLITKGDPMQAFITGGAVAAFNHYLHDRPRKSYKFLDYSKEARGYIIEITDSNGNVYQVKNRFGPQGIEPVNIEFDLISLGGTLKAGYYGLKGAFALTISPVEKAILKWSILKTTTSRGGEGYISGFIHKASNFRFNIHAHNLKGYLKVPHINFGKNGEWHIIWDSNIAKKWGYIFKGEK